MLVIAAVVVLDVVGFMIVDILDWVIRLVVIEAVLVVLDLLFLLIILICFLLILFAVLILLMVSWVFFCLDVL